MYFVIALCYCCSDTLLNHGKNKQQVPNTCMACVRRVCHVFFPSLLTYCFFVCCSSSSRGSGHLRGTLMRLSNGGMKTATVLLVTSDPHFFFLVFLLLRTGPVLFFLSCDPTASIPNAWIEVELKFIVDLCGFGPAKCRRRKTDSIPPCFKGGFKRDCSIFKNGQHPTLHMTEKRTAFNLTRF